MSDVGADIFLLNGELYQSMLSRFLCLCLLVIDGL